MRTFLPLICLLAVAAAGAAGAQTSGNPADALDPVDHPYTYDCPQGGFSVRWPSGCGTVRQRANLPDPDVDPFEQVDVVHVYCDQEGKQGAGAAVSAIINQRTADGELAGPPEVLERIKGQLDVFGVKVLDQQPIQRVLDDGLVLEGLEVKGAALQGPGEVWVRGLLGRGTIFIMSAWKEGGGLWEDPEFVVFFDSFDLIAE